MMGYGYYGGMMDGFGWVWMVLVLAAVIALTATEFEQAKRAIA